MQGTAGAAVGVLFGAAGDSSAKTPVVRGIDVSHHQRNVDWQKVSAQGYDFVFLKATEGVTWTDPLYASNVEAAKAAGLHVGAYHYGTAGSGDPGKILFYKVARDAKAEAEFFVKTAHSVLEKGCMRPALDLEKAPGIGDLSHAQLADWVIHFMETVENETGAQPLLYGYTYPKRAAKGNAKILEYDFWVADYNGGADVAPWKNFTVWQHSRKGIIDGVQGDRHGGHVDLNKYVGSEDQFRKEMLIL